MNPDEREFFRIVFFVSLAMSVIASGVVGSLIGLTNGRRKQGFFWGLLLGPLGWFIMLTLVDIRPKCRQCLGAVIKNASRCKNCGAGLDWSQASKAISKSDESILGWVEIMIIIIVLLMILASLT